MVWNVVVEFHPHMTNQWSLWRGTRSKDFPSSSSSPNRTAKCRHSPTYFLGHLVQCHFGSAHDDHIHPLFSQLTTNGAVQQQTGGKKPKHSMTVNLGRIKHALQCWAAEEENSFSLFLNCATWCKEFVATYRKCICSSYALWSTSHHWNKDAQCHNLIPWGLTRLQKPAVPVLNSGGAVSQEFVPQSCVYLSVLLWRSVLTPCSSALIKALQRTDSLFLSAHQSPTSPWPDGDPKMCVCVLFKQRMMAAQFWSQGGVEQVITCMYSMLEILHSPFSSLKTLKRTTGPRQLWQV